MATVRTKAIVIDTAAVKAELRDLAARTRAEVILITKRVLEEQINTLNNDSSMRRTAVGAAKGISRGTVDEPLKNAKVVLSERRNAADTRHARLIAYVDHPIYNILDAGRKPHVAKATFVFPVYKGNLLKNGRVQIQYNSKGNPLTVKINKGQILGGFAPLNLYKLAAEQVERDIREFKIVTPKGSSKKLKKGDVIVSVPKKREFKV